MTDPVPSHFACEPSRRAEGESATNGPFSGSLAGLRGPIAACRQIARPARVAVSPEYPGRGRTGCEFGPDIFMWAGIGNVNANIDGFRRLFLKSISVGHHAKGN